MPQLFDEKDDNDILSRILGIATASNNDNQLNDIEQNTQNDIAKEVESAANGLEENTLASSEEAPAAKEPEAPVPPWKQLQDKTQKAFGEVKSNLQDQRMADLATLPGRYLLGMKEPESLAKANEALASMPVTQLEGSDKLMKSGLDVEQLKGWTDSTSDISKFARFQAEAIMKRLNPEADISALKKMSAADLEKLGLAKGLSTSTKTAQQSDYETVDGQPLSFNPSTNSYVNILTGEPYTGEVRRKVVQGYFDPHTGERVLSDTKGRKTVISGPLGKKTEKSGGDVTRLNLHPKDKKLLDATRTAFTGDKGYVSAREALDGAENAEGLLQAGKDSGQDLVRAIQTMLAKSSGQVGVLTEQDVAGFNGRADAISRLQRAATVASKGKLPEEDRKFLLSYVKTMKSAAQRNIAQVGAIFSQQLADDLGIKQSQAEKLLNVSNRTASPPLVEMVRMKAPDGSMHDVPNEKGNVERAKQKYKFVEVK